MKNRFKMEDLSISKGVVVVFVGYAEECSGCQFFVKPIQKYENVANR